MLTYSQLKERLTSGSYASLIDFNPRSKSRKGDEHPRNPTCEIFSFMTRTYPEITT